jgi:hypothetical protein
MTQHILCDLSDDGDDRKRKRTRRKPDWRWTFLEVLSRTCCVSQACDVAGVSRNTAYDHKARFPKFAAYWDMAIEISVESLEKMARSRALTSEDPQSHTLLMFLLKAHRPEKYRDNYTPPNRVEAEETCDPAVAEAALRAAREAIESNESKPPSDT